MLKKNIIDLIYNLKFLNPQKKKIQIIHSKKKIIFKKNMILLFLGKNKKLNVLYSFISLFFSNLIFEKNLFLIFKFKNEITGNNLIPDWPGNYRKAKFIKNLLLWFKNFLKVLVYNKKLYIIILKIY